MEFKIKTKNLKAVLPAVKKALAKKVPSFVLAGVLITATKNEVELETTDLETTLKVRLQAETVEEGSVLIPFKTLEKLGAVCKEETLEFKTTETEKERTTSEWRPKEDGEEGESEYVDIKEKYIETKLKVYKLELLTMDKNEFPKNPDLTGEGIGNLNFNPFMANLKKVSEFASTDESRVILTGILLNHNELVATDSYRLAVATLDFDLGKSVVIPKNAVEVLKPIEKVVRPEAKFGVITEEQGISFEIASEKYSFTVITRALSGKFPEYKQLMPTGEGADWQYKVNSKELITVIDEADKLLEMTKGYQIPIRTHFSEGRIEVSAIVKEVGAYESTINAINQKESIHYLIFNGENIKVHSVNNRADAELWIRNATPPEGADTDKEEIKVHYTIQESTELVTAFNPYFLKTCLKNFSEPVLNLYDPLKPMLITEDGNSMRVIIMPIRVE